MVGSFCAGHCSHQQQEQHPNYNMHKFLHHQLCSSPKQSPQVLQDLNIPPRKLLSLRAAAAAAHSPSSEHIMAAPDSPDSVIALMQKFLPYNGEPCRTGNTSNNTGCCKDDDFDPDADPYSSDQFRMFEFKIRRCTRSRSHDWTDCPFAHPGEKAKRRDPRKYHYSGTVCPEYRRGGCGKGDDCEFAHGVFECWLHPSRYRTEACKDGKKCKRKVCFFAHSSRELRVLPPQADVDGGNNYDHKLLDQQQQQYCCKCCSLSPTSTLIGGNGALSHFSSSPPMSPTLSSSPPISPTMKGRSGFPRSSLSSPSTATSRYAADWMSGGGEHVSYEDVIMNEIVSSLGAMNLSRRHRDELMAAAPGCGGGGGLESSSPNGKIRRPWVDVNFEHYQQHQPEFHVLSPSTTSIAATDLLQSPIPSPTHDHDSSVGIHNNFFSGTSPAPVGTDSSSGIYGLEDKVNMDPDLGWVNDLLT